MVKNIVLYNQQQQENPQVSAAKIWIRMLRQQIH